MLLIRATSNLFMKPNEKIEGIQYALPDTFIFYITVVCGVPNIYFFLNHMKQDALRESKTLDSI